MCERVIYCPIAHIRTRLLSRPAAELTSYNCQMDVCGPGGKNSAQDQRIVTTDVAITEVVECRPPVLLDSCNMP
jgi:hypothetical protein